MTAGDITATRSGATATIATAIGVVIGVTIVMMIAATAGAIRSGITTMIERE